MIEKLELEQNPLSETVEKIREICPAAVTRDGKIDFEELKTSLATDVAEDRIEKYEFTWVGKNEAKAEANRPIRKTLRPVVADSKDWDNTKNLYIEGDNLDALKLLQESYLGKVKMIYIDPPYNTGNDFVYCDNFKMGCAEFIEKSGQCDADGNRLFANTKTNGRFHSDWCSMMYPRLKIARNLLTDDGVIFVSVDDHEQANLKKICDEIFGEDNFVSQFVWFYEGVNDNQEKVKKTHEYILCYQKNRSFYTNSSVHDINSELKHIISNSVVKNGAANPESMLVLPKGFPCEMESLHIKAQDISCIKYLDDLDVEGFKLEHNVRVVSGWSSKNILQAYIDNHFGFVYDSQNQKTHFVIKKSGNIFYTKERDQSHIISVLRNYGTTMSASKDLELMGLMGFSFPKPVGLLKFISHMATTKDAIILDFFSGSATTAHAVMQLNAEDGGNRRFIMVQLPEETDPKSEAAKAGYANICEIGKERIRRAGEKIKAENPDKDLDVGFRVLRVDSDNMADIAKRPSDITQGQLKLDVENIVPERSDLDLLFGVMVDCGLMLDMPIETKQMDDKTYYVVNHGDLVACFEKNIPEKLIYEIARMNPVCAVFRDSSFAEPKDKINLAEIFKNITGNDKCVKVL